MKTLKARRRLVALFVFFPMLFVSSATGKIAPQLGRSTFHTEHFRVHYPPHYQGFAETLSDRLEDAYVLLSHELRWKPSGKIEVVVRGDTDVPNGSAEVFPYNRLTVSAVPPDSWGFFSESDDWIRTLAIHELTHIIANDQTSGFFDFLRSIIGTAAKINPYQPAWLVEGLAVYEETAKTTRGRGRSIWGDMVVRTAALHALLDEGRRNVPRDLQVTLDRLNDGIRPWPREHTAYLYGYLLNAKIAYHHGPDAPARVSNANSAHLPFDIENVALDTVKSTYTDLWELTTARLRYRYEKDFMRIAAEPNTPFTTLTSTGRMSRGFAAAGPERFYYIRDSERSGAGISVVEDGVTKDLTYWRWGGGTRVRISPDGKVLLYSRIAPFLEHSFYSDVYAYDLVRGKEFQLTFGARAFDPEPSSDFGWDSERGRASRGSIYAGKNLDDGNQAIVSYRVASEGFEEKLLYPGEGFSRLGAPALGYGSRKNWLAFSEKDLVNGEKIRLIRFGPDSRVEESLDATKPSTPSEIASTPEWDRDGTLLYTGAKGGVFNLVRLRFPAAGRKDASSERITNFRTGALQPTRPYEGSPLYAMVYDLRGWNLARVEPGSFSDVGPGATHLENKITKWPDPAAPTVVASAPRTVAGYSVLPALLPKYWAPDVRKVEDGWSLGVQTSSFDAWENHRYRLFGGRDTRAHFSIWDLNYQFDGFYPTLELAVRRENRYFAIYGESNQIDTNEARVYMPAGWDSNVLLGFTSSTSRFFDETESTGGFQLGWNFDRMRTYDDSIDTDGESGIRGRAELTGYFAGKERFSSLDSRIDVRIPSPFRRHFFRLGANYAGANNDRLSAHYYLSRGEETITARADFLLRGYPQGIVFGRQILTSNFEYVFPVVDVFRGFGTFPAFYESSRIKLFFDVGSAEYIGTDTGDFHRWPNSVGAHFLSDFNFLYRVPVTIAVGFDYGLARDLGGESRFVVGLFSRLR